MALGIISPIYPRFYLFQEDYRFGDLGFRAWELGRLRIGVAWGLVRLLRCSQVYWLLPWPVPVQFCTLLMMMIMMAASGG